MLRNVQLDAALFLITREFSARSKDKQINRGRAQDRRQVAAGQDHEVRYEAEKMDVSKDEVRDAVKSEGNSRTKIEDKLGG